MPQARPRRHAESSPGTGNGHEAVAPGCKSRSERDRPSARKIPTGASESTSSIRPPPASRARVCGPRSPPSGEAWDAFRCAPDDMERPSLNSELERTVEVRVRTALLVLGHPGVGPAGQEREGLRAGL